MGVQGDLNALKKQRGTAKGKFTRKIFMTNNEKKATDKPKVKVKRFEPPKFEGNLREYPTFKEDYKNLVQSEYGADPYALKMCLGGEALQTIKGSEGNYDEMFKRLDDKFGNPRKIVDLVISDLKSLRKISDGFLQKERKVLEYMNSNVRTSTSDSRATVHHVENVVENNSESELVKLIRKLNEEQQSKNREFESCIVNLNEVIKGIKCKENNISIRCLLHNSESHEITNCFKFKGCNSKERFDMIKKNGICFRCLNGYHSARGCKVGKLCDVVIEGQGPCNRNHHPLLHQDRIESSSHNAVMEKRGKALLNISTVHSKNLPVTVLWDPGSDTSLITHRMAKKLGLSGKDVNLSLVKVGNTIDVNRYSDYYKLLRVTCRVMNVFKYKSFKGILRTPTVQGITDAEILWVKEMQKMTRAVYLDLAMGYSTDDFLTTFQRFIAIRGAPKFMYSDRGTQLISASKKVETLGEKEGVTWIFNMPTVIVQLACMKLMEIIKRD
ncbi:uncharacterized protein LOC119589350 [Penaeus monodon]|uniref:uncharacterized protein LOC119589350 n=1 Tax=Penaeus monodon TaxID=6687 RepID=UPI0018A74A75|nr:uncharacterized protein LOC119589350 [Penaeus monodon]